jgi:hypothetical protein
MISSRSSVFLTPHPAPGREQVVQGVQVVRGYRWYYEGSHLPKVGPVGGTERASTT